MRANVKRIQTTPMTDVNVTTIVDTPLPFKSHVNFKTRFLAGGCSKNWVNTTQLFNAKYSRHCLTCDHYTDYHDTNRHWLSILVCHLFSLLHNFR